MLKHPSQTGFETQKVHSELDLDTEFPSGASIYKAGALYFEKK